MTPKNIFAKALTKYRPFVVGRTTLSSVVMVTVVMIMVVDSRRIFDERLSANDVFTNSFVVRIRRSAVEKPAEIARKHGFHYMGKVSRISIIIVDLIDDNRRVVST